METKQIARLLGTLSIEERVRIVKSLIEARPDGLSLLDIAARTELGAASIDKQIEALLGVDIISMKTIDNNRMYYINLPILENLFEFMYHHYGPGLQQQTRDTEEASEAPAPTTLAGLG